MKIDDDDGFDAPLFDTDVKRESIELRALDASESHTDCNDESPFADE